MKNTFAGFVRGQLVSDGLLNLHGHAPELDEFGTHFGEVAPKIGLFHPGQRGIEVPGFDEGGLGSLWDSLVEDEVANVAQQAFDEETLTVVDTAGFSNLSGNRAQSTLLRQNMDSAMGSATVLHVKLDAPRSPPTESRSSAWH